MVTVEDLAREVKSSFTCGVTGAPLEVVVVKEVADVQRWLSDLHLTQQFSISKPHCFKLVKDDYGGIKLYARHMAWKKQGDRWHCRQYIDHNLFLKAAEKRGGLGEPLRVIPSPFSDAQLYETINAIEQQNTSEKQERVASWKAFLGDMNAIRALQDADCATCVTLYDAFRNKKAGGPKKQADPDLERQRRAMNNERSKAKVAYNKHRFSTHANHGMNSNTYTSQVDPNQERQPFWTNHVQLPTVGSRLPSEQKRRDEAVARSAAVTATTTTVTAANAANTTTTTTATAATVATAAAAAPFVRTDALPMNEEMAGKYDILPNLRNDHAINDAGMLISPPALLGTRTFKVNAKTVLAGAYVLVNVPKEYAYQYPFFLLARVLEAAAEGGNWCTRICVSVMVSSVLSVCLFSFCRRRNRPPVVVRTVSYYGRKERSLVAARKRSNDRAIQVAE